MPQTTTPFEQYLDRVLSFAVDLGCHLRLRKAVCSTMRRVSFRPEELVSLVCHSTRWVPLKLIPRLPCQSGHSSRYRRGREETDIGSELGLRWGPRCKVDFKAHERGRDVPHFPLPRSATSKGRTRLRRPLRLPFAERSQQATCIASRSYMLCLSLPLSSTRGAMVQREFVSAGACGPW